MDHTYSQDFKYTHKNPYHDKLGEFDGFVLRDDEGEINSGKWNEAVFKREAPLCVEVGSGYGHFMVEYCAKNPEFNYVGLDYRFKRSFELAKKLDKLPEGEKNFRYLRAKGERLEFLFAENELDNLFYFFPDPWPKTRQNKRRLFQEPFLKAAHKVLKPGGKLYVKTDHDAYAEWMRCVMKESEDFNIMFDTSNLKGEHPDHFLASFETKFEKIFLKQGINIKAFVLENKK